MQLMQFNKVETLPFTREWQQLDMGRVEKTVFISYRRTNAPWALAVFQDLTRNGYDVFFDFQGIASGDFERVILENIKARAHFLVLLTPSALERCGEPGDWLRREIETAVDTRRNIVPLMLEGFDFDTPAIAAQLTGKLAALKRYNALRVPVEYFEEAMIRLRGKYLNVPLDAVLHQVSGFAQQAAKEQQTAAATASEVQVIQSGQSERAKQAAEAFQRIGQARPKAEQAGGRERFPAEFAQAQHLVGQGHECKEREEFVQAVGFYKQAEQHFVRLCRQATLQAAQENAEDARRRMREVKEQVSTLREWAEAVWTEAQEGETCGEQAYGAQDYKHASASYERACQAYEQVGVAGQREQLRHKALAARQRTVAAREEAEQAEAERYAPGPLSRAIAAQGEAEQRWQAQDYERAAEGYERACQLYEAARVEVEEERRSSAGQRGAASSRRDAEGGRGGGSATVYPRVL
jgi:hypothetical protein